MKKVSFFVMALSIMFAAAAFPVTAMAAESRPPHYILGNKARYASYLSRNPDLPYDKIVALVNAGADKEYYSDIEIIKNPTDFRAIVSKSFAIPGGVEPSSIVPLPRGGELQADAAAAFIEMRSAAAELGLNLAVRSSYRNYGSQVASYNLVRDNYGLDGAEASVARPGHSEHQLGLALDIMHRDGTTGPLTVQGFEYSNEFFWLLENGYKYGFILRYPQAYVSIHGFVYEPWHWRYVGVRTATAMRDEGIDTFEEFYGRYLAPEIRFNKQRIPAPILTSYMPPV